MLGSLDCMHVPWKNCPLAYQGQYTSGKQGHPTIILEAVADYNLWFWHVAFGFPGSLNDINVWDNSPLLKALLDGTFASIDFEFEIGGKVFNKLWFLVDGIYPKLSRFMKTLPVACGRMWKRYASWQEAARKDIERAFGVLQSKFRIVRNPIEKWHIENIQETVTTCIILHNMMVEKRVEDGDEENVGFYEIYGDDGAVIDEEEEEEVLDPARDEVENHDAEVEYRNRVIEASRQAGRVVAESGIRDRFRRIQLIPQRYRVIMQRWEHLEDEDEHRRLMNAIARDIDSRRAPTNT
jgi:hypothetical protein